MLQYRSIVSNLVMTAVCVRNLSSFGCLGLSLPRTFSSLQLVLELIDDIIDLELISNPLTPIMTTRGREQHLA